MDNREFQRPLVEIHLRLKADLAGFLVNAHLPHLVFPAAEVADHWLLRWRRLGRWKGRKHLPILLLSLRFGRD